MNTFVSGESSAKGLSVILPYIAFDRADVAIRRPGHFYIQPKKHMTDEQKLYALSLCKIKDVYKYAHDSEWAHHIAEETQKRVMFLEHALLRLLSEIERKHELGKSVHPESIEAQTAWKLLKEPRYT